MRQLRCTWRALQDLGLDPALGRPPFPAALQEREGWVVVVRWEH